MNLKYCTVTITAKIVLREFVNTQRWCNIVKYSINMQLQQKLPQKNPYVKTTKKYPGYSKYKNVYWECIDYKIGAEA